MMAKKSIEEIHELGIASSEDITDVANLVEQGILQKIGPYRELHQMDAMLRAVETRSLLGEIVCSRVDTIFGG